jgi:flavin reductase (DIM6/NTAB) family NADH-FMN oxidoreductase RutF
MDTSMSTNGTAQSRPKRVVALQYAHRLLAPRLVALIGSKFAVEPKGWNLAPISNIACMSNEPQRIGIAVYEKWATCRNILLSREFSVNMADKSLLSEVWIAAHQYSELNYPPSLSKMDLLRLTATRGTLTETPLIAECYANIECKVVFDRSVGDHHLFVADILSAYVREDVLTAQNTVNLDRVTPIFQNSGKEFWFPAEKIDIDLDAAQRLLNSRINSQSS